jgi:protocatechuate 3,4-dioxygenase beta subunit
LPRGFGQRALHAGRPPRDDGAVNKFVGMSAVVLVLAAGFWWWSRAGSQAVAVPGLPDPATTGAAIEPPRPVEAPAPVRSVPADPGAGPPTERTPVPAPATTPQGLRGLVLDADNRPLPGVQVHLLESASNDPLGLPLLVQQGLSASALASTETGLDGTFAIGLGRVQQRTYELYLLSPRHATVRLGDLRLLAGEWHDLGAITMGPGATLRGRVTVAGLGTPVPHAVVTVAAGTAFDDIALRGLADGMQGLVATADATGHYELRHAPGRGVVQVSAVAPGFARVVRQDVELTVAQPVELDFALSPGFPLRGTVQDNEGQAIHQARIEVWPSTAAAAAFVTTSDHTGRFEVQGLSTGPHRIRASARGYQVTEVTGVEAGQLDARIVLPRRGRALVRATTPEGVVLRSYRLGVRRYFDDRGGQIGFVADVPEQNVRLDGMTDHYEVIGLPAGTFVCEVVADGHAKSLSAPFSIGNPPAAAVPRVEVVVSRGTTLRGRVLQDDGTPLEAAEVTTQADGADPESPVWKLLASAVPDRITATRARTDAEGAFVLPLLAAGDYQLEVRHPEACRTVVREVRVTRSGVQDLPPIRVPRGAVVSGRATLGGRVAGQIKVVLLEAEGGRPGPTTRLETVTDAEGAFEMPRRVPPGTYELRAAVVGTAEPDAQILRQLLQLQRSSTTVVVPAGQSVVERDIDIPDQN